MTMTLQVVKVELVRTSHATPPAKQVTLEGLHSFGYPVSIDVTTNEPLDVGDHCTVTITRIDPTERPKDENPSD